MIIMADYIPWEEQELGKTPEAQYDTIACLQVTKWIHLTAGDEGLKRSFRKMYRQLKPGGILLLEAQGWPAYTSAMKLTEKLYQAYQNINFRPEQFNEFLLSPEVGFSSHTVIGAPIHTSRKSRSSLMYSLSLSLV
ncbi:MEPCE [Cordylochernes scorpioides]|uniref:RNA methyltransferase n=1 Tax=Cordylochernes scorpioides TaxID=51811 RepID=A0ABY6KGN6_9ARAC|nr:MEPCE [Cordylochernes scorpioides]